MARSSHAPMRAFVLLYCLATGFAVRLSAMEVRIYPTTTGYVEKYHYYGTYTKFSGTLQYGRYYYPPAALWTDHAFLKFGLDSMPDTRSILSIELHYFQYEHYGGLPVVDIRLIRDPVPLSAQDLFFEIESATAVTGTGQSPDSWATWNLSLAAYPLLDSCRRTGWASLGIHWDGPQYYTYRGTAYGCDSTNVPYLRIEYTTPGTSEPKGIAVEQPELSLTPNPTVGRSVTVRSALAVGKRRRVTMRDVVGRAVCTFVLDPSGIAHLDLRGLAPGVYMATLDAGTQSLTRKLVITAR